MQERGDGWYYLRVGERVRPNRRAPGSDWVVGHWSGARGCWTICGYLGELADEHFSEIGPRVDLPDQERRPRR